LFNEFHIDTWAGNQNIFHVIESSVGFWYLVVKESERTNDLNILTRTYNAKWWLWLTSDTYTWLFVEVSLKIQNFHYNPLFPFSLTRF
jgi:hypothetical protein